MYAYTVTGTPAGGGILAVLTGAHADRQVTAHAAQRARTGAPLTAAVALRSTGCPVAVVRGAGARVTDGG